MYMPNMFVLELPPSQSVPVCSHTHHLSRKHRITQVSGCLLMYYRYYQKTIAQEPTPPDSNPGSEQSTPPPTGFPVPTSTPWAQTPRGDSSVPPNGTSAAWPQAWLPNPTPVPSFDPSRPLNFSPWLSSTAESMSERASYEPPPPARMPPWPRGQQPVPCLLRRQHPELLRLWRQHLVSPRLRQKQHPVPPRPSRVVGNGTTPATTAGPSTGPSAPPPNQQHERDTDRRLWLRTLIRAMDNPGQAPWPSYTDPRETDPSETEPRGDVQTDLRLYTMGMLNEADLVKLYGMGRAALQSICRSGIRGAVTLLDHILEVRSLEDLPETTRRSFEWRVLVLRDAAEEYIAHPSLRIERRRVAAVEYLWEYIRGIFVVYGDG
ncbi:hypothetical protein B0T19DRAFT_127871 [Cercophora scortea]|uniref:Uncharacterized protein n=1 Tax=Cercophora scortea TaxID=314031 RepID=A0AAE0IYC3_9PEZI|nr:hypothetical protein B0T19DRAFT_127871 [Cercophora scortea]